VGSLVLRILSVGKAVIEVLLAKRRHDTGFLGVHLHILVDLATDDAGVSGLAHGRVHVFTP
jgi:hypothetical protein